MTNRIEYGPVTRGIYTAMLALIPLVVLFAPKFALYYLAFLTFLGFGLRSFLEMTGLDDLWNTLSARIEKKWDKKFLDERAEEIDKRLAREKFHKSRVRDPRLPKNW